MARLIVFGTIAPANERREWKATQRHAEGGSWGVEVYHVPGWVNGDLNLGAERLQKFGEELSPKQKRQTNYKTWDAIDNDVEAVASSDIFRAFEADLKLFGNSAFQKPLADEDAPE